MTQPIFKIALLADASSVNIQVWCEGLRHAGVEVHVLSFTGSVSETKGNFCLPIPELPAKLHYFVAVPYVRRLIKRIKPNVVLGYYVTGYGTLAALTGHHPLVQVAAGTDLLLSPCNPVLKRLVRYNLSRAELVLALAPHMAQAALELGVSKDKLVILPHGVPLERFQAERCPRPFKSDVVRIVSTRSLHPAYKYDVLLRAMQLLQSSREGFFLTLAGNGPHLEELTTLSTQLGLGKHVRFAGFVPNDRLPTLLARHNLYISLIEWDGVSASLLEAMAIGLLPIVPDNPANRLWVTPGQNGLLLQDLSPAAVAAAIRSAISDVGLRERAWQQNPEIVGTRADLYQNSEKFVRHLRRLASSEICDEIRESPSNVKEVL